MSRRTLLAGSSCLLMSPAIAGAHGHSGLVSYEDLKRMIKADFVKYDSKYDMNREELETDAARVRDLMGERNLPTSMQLYNEADWLIRYSAHWPQARAVLADVRKSLSEDQEFKQQNDGSWYRGSTATYPKDSTAWYRKLEPTIDALQREGIEKQDLKPLAFMQDLQNPDCVLTLLWRLHTNHISITGRNNRDEYGAVQSALSQLLFKPKIRDLLKTRGADLKFTVSEALENAYLGFMAGVQNPDTGFWGPEYHFTDGKFTVQDLSMTFHVAHYYNDYFPRNVFLEKIFTSVPHMKRIARTTLDIKNEHYPCGWLPNEKGSKYRDHHNYDVVTLLATTYEEVEDPTLQSKAKTAVQELLDWCLARGDEVAADTSRDEAWYYAIRFLQVSGFWDETTAAPWGPMNGSVKPQKPKAFAKRLFDKFSVDPGVDPNTNYAHDVRLILTAAKDGVRLPKAQE